MRTQRWFLGFQSESLGGQTGSTFLPRRERRPQVCILNRMRLGKLIKISSGPNREKPEEAGSWDGGAEAEGHL